MFEESGLRFNNLEEKYSGTNRKRCLETKTDNPGTKFINTKLE